MRELDVQEMKSVNGGLSYGKILKEIIKYSGIGIAAHDAWMDIKSGFNECYNECEVN